MTNTIFMHFSPQTLQDMLGMAIIFVFPSASAALLLSMHYLLTRDSGEVNK